ncbi:aryl hydrocarbon receptor protein 1-like [Watersipora subatra]|uniref:aryl hydrocarbon receptor protein 1-like n=1 Tax=Watersipora subatra TaxID=2589382 RepID=UPI00355C0885
MSSQLNSSNLLRHLGPNPTPADTDRLHAIGGESHKLLQRSLIVRFRCLLDNTSGFITMEISGHLRPLYGQIGLGGLALFAVCTPFGPALLADSEVEETTFRSKLSLNMNIINLDTRGELILGHKENTTLYNLLHPFDLQYFSDAHKEMIKAGSCGLVAYRLQNKDGGWLWLQTSARVVYRNNKPDYIMCFHRNLTEEEGSNLVGKRDLELAMPHFQVTSMSLADDGEYLEDMPSKHKARKTRRNHSSIDITDPVSCDKEQQIYYQFHGFPPAVQQYASPSASYFSDSNGVPVEMGYKPVAMPSTIDYLAYPNHLHMAVEADRLAAVARIHQPPAANPYAQSYYSLGASSHTVPPCAPLPNASRYCTQNYQSTNTLFGTDANANPLLSFRDMTYPLLNQ